MHVSLVLHGTQPKTQWQNRALTAHNIEGAPVIAHCNSTVCLLLGYQASVQALGPGRALVPVQMWVLRCAVPPWEQPLHPLRASAAWLQQPLLRPLLRSVALPKWRERAPLEGFSPPAALC